MFYCIVPRMVLYKELLSEQTIILVILETIDDANDGGDVKEDEFYDNADVQVVKVALQDAIHHEEPRIRLITVVTII